MSDEAKAKKTQKKGRPVAAHLLCVIFSYWSSDWRE
jgi:hypothetical protein